MQSSCNVGEFTCPALSNCLWGVSVWDILYVTRRYPETVTGHWVGEWKKNPPIWQTVFILLYDPSIIPLCPGLWFSSIIATTIITLLYNFSIFSNDISFQSSQWHWILTLRLKQSFLKSICLFNSQPSSFLRNRQIQANVTHFSTTDKRYCT